MLIQFLHSPDDGQPDGGDSGDGGAVRASDVLNRYGKNDEAALRLAEKLADAENTLYKLREKNRTLRQDNDALKAKLPADGAVVVPQADAAALDAYRALGTPDTLKQALDAKTTAEGELSTLRRDATLRDVQEATGFDRDVLREIGGAWEYTIKQEQIDGKDVRAVYVKDGDQETRIDQHPKVVKFLPALKPNAATPPAPDINGGARSPANGPTITDQDRERATARYRATF